MQLFRDSTLTLLTNLHKEREGIITIRPARVTLILGVVALVLVVISIATQVARFVFGYPYIFGLSAKFYIGEESNIPTYYSAMLLLVASLLIAVIAWNRKRQQERFRGYWWLLSAVFLFLSVDEAASLHELTSGWLRGMVRAEGLLYYPWVIAGAFSVLLFAIVFARFLLHLPRETRMLFTMSGGVYVGGALIVELIEAVYAYEHGADNLPYTMITTFEESMELGGAILFIHALLRYIARHIGVIQLRFAETR